MGYRSWRQSKRRSSSSFPSPFSILERKGHKSLCEEEQAELAVTQDLKEGSPPTPENFFANRLCDPACESPTASPWGGRHDLHFIDKETEVLEGDVTDQVPHS